MTPESERRMNTRTVPATEGPDFTVALRPDGSVTVSRRHNTIALTRQDVAAVFNKIRELTQT